MKLQKLASMPYAQAYVVRTENRVALISYKTLVCEITDGWLEVFGLYSQTTRRHIGAFMKEFVEYPNGTRGTYQDAKACYTNGYRFNVKTGEIKNLA